jgi:signal peptidase I
MSVYFPFILFFITAYSGVWWSYNKFAMKKNKGTQIKYSFLNEYAIEVFPLVAFIFIIRSFIIEPFQIPSGSMMPTLENGDFIAVNKFTYGIKDPLFRNKFLNIGEPDRGDVIVFKYPIDPDTDFIKRVIGLPGDKIKYKDNSLYIKKKCTTDNLKCSDFVKVSQEIKSLFSKKVDEGGLIYKSVSSDYSHDIFIDKDAVNNEPFFCTFAKNNICTQKGTSNNEYIVPNGHYFVLGDNRNYSLDSRFWGFVPEENIVGKAIFVWMSFEFSDNQYLPNWIPTGVRFSRIGGIN